MTTVRRAARVLLVDETGSVLLFFGIDASLPDDPGWWLTVGGGVEGDESLQDAAIREVFEETGVRLDRVDGPLGERDTTFAFEGEEIHQFETYFAARVDRFDPNRDGWTDLERRSLFRHRWWSIDDLRASTETIYPENLLELLELVTR